MANIFDVLLSISLIGLTSAFKNGAPAHVCLSPYPHHKPSKYEPVYAPQPLETVPVDVSMSSNTYGSTRQPIEIVIKTIGHSYEGLLMMIRSTVPVTHVPIGEFLSCNSTAIKFLKSESNITNCLTHKDNKPKPRTIMCKWQPPYLENYGNLELVLSIVQSYTVFWVDLTRPILYDNVKKLPYNYPGYMIPPVSSVKPSGTPVDVRNQDSVEKNFHVSAFSLSKCGVERHCLLYPPSCALTSNCKYMVSVEDLGPKGVAFELVAPLEGYFGFGMSPYDKRAHEALVTVCRTNLKTKHVSLSTGDTRKHYLFEEMKDWIVDRSVGVDTNWMGRIGKVCRYRIPNKTVKFKSSPEILDISLNDDLYYYFATGSMYEDTDYICGHTQNPLKSNGKINLLMSEYSIHYMSAFVIGEKCHATIMIVAWVLLIPIGTMIPRYFKNVWTMTYIRKVLWLLTHMITVISGALLSIISYILILVINHGWRSLSQLHGIFGSLTIGAGLLNIAIGFNRPDPKAKNRPLFNYIHFSVAVLSKLLSYVTFWTLLLTWGMNTNFVMASCIINAIWNFMEVFFYGLSFRFQKDKPKWRFFDNRQFVPPSVFLISYVGLECLIATSLLVTVWIN